MSGPSNRAPDPAPWDDCAAWGDDGPPLVSVGVVTYNQRAFLRECLDSVLAQDHPRLQVVVGDDGSTDGTPEMLRAYARDHPGVFVLCLSPRNRGITANCNAVLAACTGRYIAWLGGDDLMLPGKLSRQAAFMEAHPDCALCYHNLDVFDSDSGRTLRLYNRLPGERFAGRMRFTPREGGPELLARYGTFLGACSVMTRRGACPPRFDERVRVASDWLFFLETATRGRIRYIPEVLGRYRRHANNVTHTSGALGQELLTLDIVDERYPHLRSFSAAYRRNHFLRRAARRLQARDPHGAWSALRQAAAWGTGRATPGPLPPHPVSMPRVSDARGSLSFVQQGTHVPFDIGGARWVVGTPGGDVVDGAAPSAGPSFLVALAGAYEVEPDGGVAGRTVTLDAPDRGLALAGGARVRAVGPDGVLLALSATPDADPSERAVPADVPGLLSLPSRGVQGAQVVTVVPGRDVPCPVRRVFYLYDIPPGETRGHHAHRALHQVIVCVAGGVDVVLDDGVRRTALRLDAPHRAAHVAPLVWCELSGFAPGTVCMVLASAPYDEADYIRDRGEFQACVARGEG